MPIARLALLTALAVTITAGSQAQSLRERMQQGVSRVQQGASEVQEEVRKGVSEAAGRIDESVDCTVDLMTNEATPQETRDELDGMASETLARLFEEGSVGRAVMDNLLTGGFAGDVWAINPKYDEVGGRTCFRTVNEMPRAPDLAVIVTPPATVPELIGQLGEKGTRAAVVITAGLTQENGLRQAMLDAAKPFLFRIIGPNTLGLMVPPIKLNASFAHLSPTSGGLALLSQSGAIASSLVDWAAEKAIGFSHLVSLGDMADVDVGDYLDMLAGDQHTRAILLYLESIPNPRKFMSAARAASRLKPVIAIKSGRHELAAKAAATHTGALSGADRVVDAALRRAGVLRVGGLAELFDAAETLARFRPLERARVAIVTNGGGAGVLAVDQLMDCGGCSATIWV